MCASSAGEIPGCSVGLLYSGSQNATHVNPATPVTMNAHCQPQVSAMIGTTAGAMMAPTFEPALKIPVAVARSFFGNHSAVVLIAAGKFPASPMPSAKRAAMKLYVPRAKACAAAAIDQTIRQIV